MAANEKAAGNVAMKLHVFAQQKKPSIGADVLPMKAKGPNQKLMSSSQECLGMNRPHKTVEYDLDTVLSKENESSPTIMSETETKPDHNVRNRKWPQSQLSPQVKWHAIGKEPIKVMAWSPSRLVAV
jgi:hypothetical protein